MPEDFKEQALQYHRLPRPGKIQVMPTTPLANQRDLALAYSPGVAEACNAIVADPAEAANLTIRSNLVAVITNGTAVLGLGAIGPLASKPVMEGKGVLFKKFAGIDVFDIEINETDPAKLIDIIASLEPTFGGINLEDIKAPECFEVEGRLRERMNIPVFHDDQHGTAIIVAAALLNGLRLVEKNIGDVKIAVSGAGAAGLACLDLFVGLGVARENITVCDIHGVVYKGRTVDMDPRKSVYAQETEARKLDDVIGGADVFLGLSAPGVLTQDMVKTMADRPLILALANPTPEITPELVKAVRDDAIMATGRSDYPNQVNNVLCFPYIFRGALDVGASEINEEMKLACVRALADMTMTPPSEDVIAAYGGEAMQFGPEYIIPKPFDPRLIMELPIAVAQAAMDSGVATRPIQDFNAYREELSRYVFRSGMVMKPVFESAKADPKRVVFADGEEKMVLRAIKSVVEEGLARPIVIGRREKVEKRLRELSLNLIEGDDFELIDPFNNPHYEECWTTYHKLREREGIDPHNARIRINTRTTVLGAMLVYLGYADTMLCGYIGRYQRHLKHTMDVLALAEGVHTAAALSMLITPKGTVFICDTHVNLDPTAQELAEITVMAAEEVRRFGLTPNVALLSHSNFGSHNRAPGPRKMAEALKLINKLAPELEAEGEMQADTALSEDLRSRLFPNSRLSGSANLLIMPNMDAANIAYNLVKMMTDAVVVGPMLLGLSKPAHVVTRASTVRRLVNMTAVAVVDAQAHEADKKNISTAKV